MLAILLFGGAQLFSRTARSVSVFAGSVSGLAVGSPVTFRGVTICKVEAIQVQLDETNHTGVIPVAAEAHLPADSADRPNGADHDGATAGWRPDGAETSTGGAPYPRPGLINALDLWQTG